MTSMLPDATVRYADHDDGVIDLHLPQVPSGRVVVLVHGGFWKLEHDRRHTREMAGALAARGHLVATPEYRRVRGGGGWPITCEDVRDAITRLPMLLDGLGLPRGPVTVAGHSAGGHLALWLATTGVPVRRVVALAPVSDLYAAMRLGLGDRATQAFLGEAAPEPADPMTLFAHRPDVEIVIVHGDADADVPVSLSRGFVAAHPWVQLHEVAEAGHMDLIDPGSSAWPTVRSALETGD
jgi:acetyl esterase/lipase